MALSKDRIYQDVLRLLADARLASVSDDAESRYALDDAWDEAVVFVLRQAAWRFALKTVTLGFSTSTPLPGFQYLLSYPGDWLLTYKIYVVASDGRQCPIDLRESGDGIATNLPTVQMQYVSDLSNAITDETTGEAWTSGGETITSERDLTLWPEHVAQTLVAYLAFLTCERITGERGASARFSQLFSQLLGEAIQVDAEQPDPWLAHQRAGKVLRGARNLLRVALWRFAMVDSTFTVTGAGGEVITDNSEAITDEVTGAQWTVETGSQAPGFSHSIRMPDDWINTYKLFVLTTDLRERPFDIREQGGFWSTSAVKFTARYVSKELGLDSTKWEEPFTAALLDYLDAGMPQVQQGQSDQSAAAPQWRVSLGMAQLACADLPDDWLPFQLSGEFDHGKRAVLQSGYWVWPGPDGVMHGLKEKQYSALDDQVATQASYAFPYRFQLPSDHFKTHALFEPWDGRECPININETGHDWSTDAEAFVARYVSADVLDVLSWPETVMAAVLGYLQARAAPPAEKQARDAEYAALLSIALAAHSRPANEWLPYQLSGKYPLAVNELLEQGRWRFAIRTVDLTESSDPIPADLSDGTPSSSYGYRFIKPNDLMRAVWVHYLQGSGAYGNRIDIDYRDEGGAFHANYTPITVRYVSRLGLDSTKWPAGFHDAVLAWLKYSEARADIKLVGQAAALLKIFEDRARDVERLDDARDRPAIRGSRVIAARYGSRSSSRSRELGYWGPFS